MLPFERKGAGGGGGWVEVGDERVELADSIVNEGVLGGWYALRCCIAQYIYREREDEGAREAGVIKRNSGVE